MTNLLHTRLSRSVGNSDSSAMACAGEAVAEARATARLGDELLRHLPPDRRSSAAPISLAEAAYKITGDRLDQLFQACVALAAGRDTFFLTTFATLLARLAGQEAVTVRNCYGDPTILTLAFDPEASFRGLLHKTQNEHALTSDRPCAVEIVFASSRVSFADMPGHGLRMVVHSTDSEAHVRLASTTGLWDQTVLRLWLRYFDHLLAAAAAAPDIPWKTLPLLDEIDAQEFYLALNDTAVAYPADAWCMSWSYGGLKRHQIPWRSLRTRSASPIDSCMNAVTQSHDACRRWAPRQAVPSPSAWNEVPNSP